MSFTFNDLNGSSKSTAACSTNSPSKSNLNTDDIVKKTGDKTNLNIDSAAAGGSCKSDGNSSLFVFGSHIRKKNTDLKAAEGFNFVFNSSSKSNTESKAVNSNTKSRMEPKLGIKTGRVFDSDDNNGNSSENSTENSVKDEELNNREQKQDAVNGQVMIVKTLVEEFKRVMSSFVEERFEGEKKIAALEGRIHCLERQVENLKNADSKEGSTVNVTRNNDAAKPMVNPVSQQPLDQPPKVFSLQTPSPVEPCSPKKSAFGSTCSLNSASSASSFNGTSTHSFGATASSLFGNDAITSSNFTLGTSLFNPRPPTLTQGSCQLMSVPTSNQDDNNLALEPKRAAKKPFTREAVTTFLKAHEDPAMHNNLTKVKTGNPLKKISTGQESLQQNQNISSKEAFQANLQKTIEASVEKFMEEYWENSRCNASEDNFKKFCKGNKF